MRASPTPLPRGVTGLRYHKDPELPLTDLRPFRTALHHLGRSGGPTLSAVVGAGQYWTYHTATYTEVDGRELAVLCHRHLPWIVWAEPGRDLSFTPWFVQPPPWAEHFSWLGFTVLDLDFLLAPAAGADLSALGRAEREQVRYWKPRLIGEIAFNRWD